MTGQFNHGRTDRNELFFLSQPTLLATASVHPTTTVLIQEGLSSGVSPDVRNVLTPSSGAAFQPRKAVPLSCPNLIRAGSALEFDSSWVGRLYAPSTHQIKDYDGSLLSDVR